MTTNPMMVFDSEAESLSSFGSWLSLLLSLAPFHCPYLLLLFLLLLLLSLPLLGLEKSHWSKRKKKAKPTVVSYRWQAEEPDNR